MRLDDVMRKCADEHNVSVDDVTIIDITPGVIHVCETETHMCRYYGSDPTCYTTLSNADWVVEMQYDNYLEPCLYLRLRAIYGVLGEHIACWMD